MVDARPKTEIIATDDGFTIKSPKHADTVSFNRVSTVAIYKRDEMTTDLICCDIVVGEQVRTVHEEIPGFNTLMLRFEALPGFDRKWREKVVKPAFAENRTIVFQRSTCTTADQS